MEHTTEEKTEILRAYVNQLQEYTGRSLLLSAADLASLAHIMVMRVYRRRSDLIKTGDKEQYLHFIVKGLVRQYFYDGTNDVTIHFAREGEAVSSFISYFAGTSSICQLETLEPTLTLALPRARLEQLYPYSTRINRMARVILSAQILQLENWELNHLRYSIRERFLMFIKNNQELYHRVPYKYQASYLDIKPETYSRLKTQLERKVRAIHGK
ncbi:MAG: Crp/Fnr family transcriptional regulator [Chitinophagaceae bacterium]|nr:Crp/Fnr family transcriptional regulator [Chitinophagaceae bacterium]